MHIHQYVGNNTMHLQLYTFIITIYLIFRFDQLKYIFIMFFYLVFLFAVILILRLYYIWHTLGESNHCQKKTLKVLAVAGSGGHTSELLRLLSSLPKDFTPRVYIIASSDKMSLNKINDFESKLKLIKKGDFDVHTIPRSREVRQSWSSTVFTTIYATIYSIPLVWSVKPDLILCNGPGTCVPICFISFVFKVCGFIWTDIIFVESICRVTSISMTGRLLYPIANKFYVQWPALVKEYPKALYFGGRLV